MTACLVANLANGSTLWVGDWNDALTWINTEAGTQRICVLENVGGSHLADWLLYPIKDDAYHVSTARIEAAVDKITEILDQGNQKLLVHCAAGIERSPLTCAYWLRKMKVHSTLAAAYTHLKIIRPIVEDRTSWLDMDKRLP